MEGLIIFLMLSLAGYSGAKVEKDRVDAHCVKHPHGIKCKNVDSEKIKQIKN